MSDFPSASYDHWKTTPPDDWYGNEIELTPEEEAEQWFDDWYGEWLSDMFSADYELSVDAQAGAELPDDITVSEIREALE